jgi:PhnB protein
MPVKPIPEGYATVTPFLIVAGAGKLIDYMKQAFGARERLRMPMPDGGVAHAELEIGDSVVMVSDGSPQFPPIKALLHLYVEDADAVFQRALDAGSKVVQPLEDQFYGDRSGTVEDEWGNRWSIATHIEDVSEEEMMKRMAAMGAPQ